MVEGWDAISVETLNNLVLSMKKDAKKEWDRILY